MATCCHDRNHVGLTCWGCKFNRERRVKANSDRILHCGENTGFSTHLGGSILFWLWWCGPPASRPKNAATWVELDLTFKKNTSWHHAVAANQTQRSFNCFMSDWERDTEKGRERASFAQKTWTVNERMSCLFSKIKSPDCFTTITVQPNLPQCPNLSECHLRLKRKES